MPNIKIEKFWPKDIKDHAKNLSNALERMDFSSAQEQLNNLLEILKNTSRDGKSRVTICFIIGQLANIDPLIDSMVSTLMEILDDEKDSHVKEFSVWALGRIVEESQSIDLIKETMPIFIKFCSDQSTHVKQFAEDIKDKLNLFLAEKKNLDEKIKVSLKKLNELIQGRINEMNVRAQNLSKEALSLDYRAAFERRKEMEDKIHEFKELNAISEDEILALQEQLINDVPAFKGESRNLIHKWREIRGEKEALIRRVHCILRIQGKIFRIISHIKSRADGKIDISALKEETQYSDFEIIEILKKLVDEEILPNFMLDQIEGGLESIQNYNKSENGSLITDEKLINSELEITKKKNDNNEDSDKN